jgi:hypothetical protein
MTEDRSFLTVRDAEALGWIGEQYGVREDALRVLLGRWRRPGRGTQLGGSGALGYQATRDVVGRWERNGWVERRRLFGGRVWVIPTARGLEVGRREDQAKPFEVWKPAGVTLAHVHACAVVRLWMEEQDPACGWHSERVLRRRANEERAREGRTGPGGPRMPDAEVIAARDERLLTAAVEVELTVKDAKRYAQIARDYASEYELLWWFTWPEDGDRLTQMLIQAGAQHDRQTGGTRRVEVDPLPELPGVTYEARL